ncbi:hypothetical protein EDC04DRAFT_2671806 [Pisolithus marmoratus]|nr:hypothetical protein EDC04DRAFT_2671806 [Pisolithus marmoratus]
MNLYKYADRAVVLFVLKMMYQESISVSPFTSADSPINQRCACSELLRLAQDCILGAGDSRVPVLQEHCARQHLAGTHSKEVLPFPIVTNLRSPSIREEHRRLYATFSGTPKHGFYSPSPYLAGRCEDRTHSVVKLIHSGRSTCFPSHRSNAY